MSKNGQISLQEYLKSSSLDAICGVKTGKKYVTILKNQTVAVMCSANTGPVHRVTPVLFESDRLAHWPEGLEVNETVINIKSGSVQGTSPVHNGTDGEPHHAGTPSSCEINNSRRSKAE